MIVELNGVGFGDVLTFTEALNLRVVDREGPRHLAAAGTLRDSEWGEGAETAAGAPKKKRLQ